MRLFRKLAATVLMLSALPVSVQAQPAPSAPAEKVVPSAATSATPTLERGDVEAWLDGFMPYALDRGEIAGAIVVVVKGDQTVLQKGYGYSDVAKRAPVDPESTMFRPGSISKLFTWTAVMQQVEEGRIDLDKDVNTYLDFKIPPYQGKPITMRQIMTHTAGFEESIRYLISADPKAALPLQDYVKKALPARVFAPGTTPAYSNYATALAGYVVERVSGTPFDDYIETRIFQPLGMSHSSFRQPLPERFKPFMSLGYPTSMQKPEPFEIVIPGPAGSLSASGADMAQFMKAHLADGGPLLKPETAKMMHDYRAPNIGSINTMALGFYEQWINGRRAIAHGGDTGWFHSYLWLFPGEDVGLYISMNSDGKAGAAQAVRAGLFQRFAERYMPETKEFGAIDAKTAREHAQLMAGQYEMSRGAFTNFMSVLGLLGPNEVLVGPEGQLMIPSLDGLSAGPRDWVEIEPFVWRDRNTGERLIAEVKDGRVTRFSIDTFSPFTVMTPVAPGLNPAWLIPALIGAIGLATVAALAWPVRALVRRSYKAEFPLKGRSLLAYRLSRGFAWLVLAAVACWIGMIMAFTSDIGAVGGPLDWLIQLARVVTPLAAFGLTAASGWHLWNCFKDKRSWTMKLGAFLLVLSGLVLVWVTLQYHLYGFGLVY